MPESKLVFASAVCKVNSKIRCAWQAHPLLQVVLCALVPIDIPGVDCVTYELEDLGVDNVAQILTSLAPQVLPLPIPYHSHTQYKVVA